MQSLQMQLLHLLQEDCRLPLEKLAVMSGSTVETVATVIDDMERNGIILRYAPVINWDKTDRERVEAMIEVRVTPQRDQGFDAIAEQIYRFEEVRNVYLMSGGFDLAVCVNGRSMQEIAMFVARSWPSLSAPSSARWKPSQARQRILCSSVTKATASSLRAMMATRGWW